MKGSIMAKIYKNIPIPDCETPYGRLIRQYPPDKLEVGDSYLVEGFFRTPIGSCFEVWSRKKYGWVGPRPRFKAIKV